MDRRQKIAGLIGLALLVLGAGAGAARADDLVAKRPYRLYAPAGLDPARPAPLLLLLHCYGCSSSHIARFFDIEALADARGFLVAIPDGKIDARDRRFWNASDSCCDLDGRGVDDVAYLTAVLDDVIKKRRVDPKRIYAMGFSNGGFMAHRLACDRASRFAAVVSLAGAGANDPARCRPSEPVAVVEIHGTADELVPFAGGKIPGVAVPPLPAARATVAAWAAHNGCAAAPERGAPLDVEATLPGAETTVERYPACKGGAAELWTIHGGRHVPTLAHDFAARAWEFLAAHPKP